MTGEPGANGAGERAEGQDDLFGLEGPEREESLAWMREHLSLMRESAYGQRVYYWIFGVAIVVGLAVHVGGFLLRSSATTEPVVLAGDVLYSLGFALWTGVVVAIFVQIWPDTKKRQFKRALDAYEAAVGRQGRVRGRRTPDRASAERDSFTA